MTRAAFYPKADTSAQNFAKAYRGSTIHPNVVVLHTTEGGSWPSYSGGATAPNFTCKPNLKTKTLEWRQHFPTTMSARALKNLTGGVETNTLNACQVEMVGTCDPRQANKMFFWPEAPDWALDGVAEFIAWMNKEWALQLKAAPKWAPYPSSYANGARQRFSNTQWANFYGVCGHQHVPENVHGDPGDLDAAYIIAKAKTLVAPPKPPKPTKPASKTPRLDEVIKIADDVLGGRVAAKKRDDWKVIRDTADNLRDQANAPKKKPAAKKKGA